jgi:FkbM family methyltransferase
MEYYSQLGQDKFIDDFFSQKENGFFLDIGAHDGVTLSNTYFLEKFRNWKGICIEPGPLEFEKLNQNRKSLNLNICVSNFNGFSKFTYIEGYSNMLSGLSEDYVPEHQNRIKKELSSFGGDLTEINVEVKKLQTILDENSITEIDFCSIDTEGSEFKIITSIDFSITNIKVLIIENNYNDGSIKYFLEEKGYILHQKIKWDDVFVKKELLL